MDFIKLAELCAAANTVASFRIEYIASQGNIDPRLQVSWRWHRKGKLEALSLTRVIPVSALQQDREPHRAVYDYLRLAAAEMAWNGGHYDNHGVLFQRSLNVVEK